MGKWLVLGLVAMLWSPACGSDSSSEPGAGGASAAGAGQGGEDGATDAGAGGDAHAHAMAGAGGDAHAMAGAGASVGGASNAGAAFGGAAAGSESEAGAGGAHPDKPACVKQRNEYIVFRHDLYVTKYNNAGCQSGKDCRSLQPQDACGADDCYYDMLASNVEPFEAEVQAYAQKHCDPSCPFVKSESCDVAVAICRNGNCTSD